MEDELLIKLAECVLHHHKGYGAWQPWDADPEDVHAMKGLSVGDTVYCYASDEQVIVDHGVHFVVDGVGYLVCLDSKRRPRLDIIEGNVYFKTREECISFCLSTMKEDMSYCLERAEDMKRLQGYIDEGGI